MNRLDSLITSLAPTCDLVGDDPSGELLEYALATSEAVYLACRNYTEARRALDHPRRPDITIAGIDASLTETVERAGTAMMTRLPGSLASLDLLACTCARAGHGIIAGANTKHMSRGHNAILADSYSNVRASLGSGKFRCLLGSDPTCPDPHTPLSAPSPYGELYGFGGVFGGARVDRGGELLGQVARRHMTGGEDVIDLGCGNGLVSLMVADVAGSIRATDVDLDAVRAASLTLENTGAEVSWGDGGLDLEPASADVVALNPPFHSGTTVDMSLVDHLLDCSVRLLRPGGTLFLVHNSHARYRGRMEERFEVTQLERNPKFTVLGGRLRQG